MRTVNRKSNVTFFLIRGASNLILIHSVITIITYAVIGNQADFDVTRENCTSTN